MWEAGRVHIIGGGSTMEKNHKHLDPASFGPMGFLMRSVGQGLKGLFSLLKSPLVLLPMVVLVGVWLFLPHVSGWMEDLGVKSSVSVIKAIKFLTFAEGGMYAGKLGAVGGIIGKAFMAWFVTVIFLPLFKRKKKSKSVKMEIGPAFVIKRGVDFALLFAGIGSALILYNFKTGNGSVTNSAVAVASIIAAFKSLKNPRGFMVEFIRSFTKGRMKRATAGHFVVGIIIGNSVAIVMAILMKSSGPLGYILGTILLLLSLMVRMIFKDRKHIAMAAAVVLLSSFLMGPVLNVALAGDTEEFKDAYEIYNIEQDDFEGLKAAILAKPFQSAQITPIGMSIGMNFAPIIEAESIVISSGVKTSLSILAKSKISEEYNNVLEVNESFFSEFNGQISIFYDKNALVAEGPSYEESMGRSFRGDNYDQNTQKLPFFLESSGIFTGSAENRFDEKRSVDFYRVKAEKEVYPIIFETYSIIDDNYYGQQGEFDYGKTLNPGDLEGQLYLMVKVAGGSQVNWNKGMTTDEGVYSIIFFRVDSISFKKNPEKKINEKKSLVWVLEDTILGDTTESEGTVTTENGRIIYNHLYLDGSLGDKMAYTWTVPPERIPFSEEISIPTKMSFNWLGDPDYPPLGVFTGGAYIFAKLGSSTRDELVYEAYFENDEVPHVGQTFYFTPGEEFESIFDLVHIKENTGDTPFDELTYDNSYLSLLINGSHSGGSVNYIYRLSSELSYEITDGKSNEDLGNEEQDDEDKDLENFNFGDFDWNEYADSDLQTKVNGASVVGAILGAGAALAGFSGFGGSGPGGLKIPGGQYDPSDGTLILSYPGGSQEMFTLNLKTGEFESSYGSVLNVDKIESTHEQMDMDKKFSKEESERMSQKRDVNKDYLNKLKQINKLKEKYRKQALEGEDNISILLAKHLDQLEQDIYSGKGLDEKKLTHIRELHGKFTRGEIANKNQIPGEYSNWQHAKDTIELSSEEISRGESGKAIALRMVLGAATLGKSEFGFEVARSVYNAKDYVDKGGDSWTEFMGQAAKQTIAEEGIGRVMGIGIKVTGKAGSAIGSKIGNTIEKTTIGRKMMGQLSKVSQTISKYSNIDLVEKAKSILGVSPASSKAGQALKAANAKATANAIKAANKQLDDAVKAAGKQADDLAKTSKGVTGKVAKESGKVATDKAAKESTKTLVDKAAKKSSQVETHKAAKASGEKVIDRKVTKEEIEATEKQWSESVKKSNQQAEEEILKFKQQTKAKSSEAIKRDNLYRQGEKIGDQKVANLKRAQDRLNANPSSSEAQEVYDIALRSVQQDKFAMNSLKKYEGKGANELRGNFNMRNEQHTQAALQNSRERLAQEHGANPEDIKIVEATNTGAQTRTVDASRTAHKVDQPLQTKANFHGTSTADDIVSSSAQIKKAPMDKDVTARIYDKKTKQWIDLPKEDVSRVYNQELYKTHHKNQLPTTQINGKEVIDEEAIHKFAKKMDHTVTDRTGVDAYGTGDIDLVTILDKKSTGIKQFQDITSITGTMEYKSNEWFSMANDMRDEAAKLLENKGSKSAAEQLLRQAEASQGEGIRQLVKQFDNQVSQQIKAAANTGKNIKIPEKLMKSIRILDNIGKDGGISVVEAESILKGMNTTIDDIVQQTSLIMEVIAKFK